MTATATSPKDLMNAHAAGHRANAAAEGGPTDRAAFPGLGVEPTAMIFSRRRALMFKPVGGAARALDAATLADLLVSGGASAAVSDRPTFERMIKFADALPPSNDSKLGRRLRIIRGLPRSMKLPVLTDALAYRYWLPEDLDPKSLDDWALAFGVKGPTGAITMANLIPLARSASAPSSLGFKESAASLETLERNVMEQCIYTGISTDCYVYSMMDSYGAKEAGMRTIDPGLLETHMIDGTVCKMVPLNVDSRTVSMSVSAPFRLKEGKKIRLTDGAEISTAMLKSLQYSEGSLYAVLEAPGPRSKAYLMIDRAKKGTAALFGADEVFENIGSGLKNKRWMGGDVEPISGRDVPLDVILAGGPVG